MGIAILKKREKKRDFFGDLQATKTGSGFRLVGYISALKVQKS